MIERHIDGMNKMIDRLLNKRNKAVICLLLVFVMSFILFYRYIFNLQTSDFPAHIEMAESGYFYSLNLILFSICQKISDSYALIACLMSMIIVSTVLATAYLLKTVLGCLEQNADYLSLIPVSSSFLFVCKLCIPEWSPFFYKASISTQPWHNSTYILMRLFGVLVLAIYIVIRKDYLKKIQAKQLFFFFLLLFLVNFSKPNFVIAFAPIMLMVLTSDFLRSRGKSFKNAFLFGVAVLLACSILIFQYTVLFPSNGESGVAFSLQNGIDYLSKDKKFPLQVVLNFAFPIYTTYLVLKNRNSFNLYGKQMALEVWAMNILSFLESIFIIETGPRQADGNFEWGIYFFAYVLFVLCIGLLKKLRRDELISDIEYATARNLYFAQIVFGVFYYALLVIGYLSWII